MYQINKIKNELNPLSEKKFSELKFREREHLQEWLAKCPTALGEELLIIQKEFDGFDETRERLDLLALDKADRSCSPTGKFIPAPPMTKSHGGGIE